MPLILRRRHWLRRPHNDGGVIMAKPLDHDARQAALYRDLETQILDLRDMAAIMTEYVTEQVNEHKATVTNGFLVFEFDRATVRQIVFALYNVSNRAEDLAALYESGFQGNREKKAS
jgi:hypothetical protein